MDDNKNKRLRLRMLQRKLGEAKIDAAILVLSRDIYYYSGTAQPSILLITPDNYRLMVRRAMDFVLAEVFIKHETIEEKGDFHRIQQYLQSVGITNGKIGIEMDIIPAALFIKMRTVFSNFDFIDISNMIFHQRMIKDDGEIRAIRQACRIMDAGHQRVLETLHPGMTELELAAEVEYAHRRQGHEGVLSMRHFDFYISRGPLCAGDNVFKVSGFANTITGVGLSSAIPAGPSNYPIKKGDLTIVDIPTCYQGYHCDQTRTYILGTPINEVLDLFKKLKEISKRTRMHVKEGITCQSLFETAYETAKALGVENYFLGLEPRKGDFVGHGIGLDANEPPILKRRSNFVLRANMTLTIELHLSHPEYGAVKLEDMVLVKETGREMLSITPRELFIV